MIAVGAHPPIQVMLLGTGTSHGVPMIACDCAVCTSPDPRDRRYRPCAYVRTEAGALLIDTPPELRLACLANDVRRCDAVLFTHHHIDHVAGLDDLRRFNWLQKRAIPCFAQRATIDHLIRMFPYATSEADDAISAVPQLSFQTVSGPFRAIEREILPIPLLHGPLPVLGFRIGGFAYCTDVSTIPDESWSLLRNLDVLVLDALRRRPHPTHFNLDQAVETARRIGAERTYFTHIAHELGHAQTNAELPAGMQLAYDGLVLTVE